jgi:hypothetical protein
MFAPNSIAANAPTKSARGARRANDLEIMNANLQVPPCNIPVASVFRQSCRCYARGVPAAAAISVDRLVVNRGGRRVLDEITFDVGPGEIAV